jgi:hypothetical protein
VEEGGDPHVRLDRVTTPPVRATMKRRPTIGVEMKDKEHEEGDFARGQEKEHDEH